MNEDIECEFLVMYKDERNRQTTWLQYYYLRDSLKMTGKYIKKYDTVLYIMAMTDTPTIPTYLWVKGVPESMH